MGELTYLTMEEKGNSHLNTTLSLPSDLRLVVQRDYSQGLLTQWKDEFPEGLEQFGVTEEQFHYTIQHLNRMFKETEEYRFTTFLEASLACLSFYTLYICIPGQYQRGKRRIEQFIESQNNEVYLPNVQWLNPYRNGLL